MKFAWFLGLGLIIGCSSSASDKPGLTGSGGSGGAGAGGEVDAGDAGDAVSSGGNAGAGSGGNIGNVGSGGADAAAEGPAPSAEILQVCSSFARALCAKLETCSSFVLQRLHGDAATCRERTTLDCVTAFDAPGTSATPARTAACDQSLGALSCASFLVADLGVACKTDPGSIAVGGACATDAQCATTFCARAADATCGICQPPTAPGSPCVRGSCSAGTVCPAGQSKCITPVAGKVDDPCTALEQCDLAHAIGCNTAAGKCLSLTLASAGGTCGANSILVTSYAVCPANGACSAPFLGRCSAAAKDGERCSTADTGPLCLLPARCVGGRCTLPDPRKCQ